MVLLSFSRLGGEFLTKLAGIGGVFVRLQGQFVRSEMISFAVGGCGGRVGMGCKVMELCDSIVGALWHGLLLISSMFGFRYEICSRAKTGILTPSRNNQKAKAAANSPATTGKGSGAMAIPKIASVEMIRRSATEEPMSHMLGRKPQRWRRSRMA
jgi:hypothetical protein